MATEMFPVERLGPADFDEAMDLLNLVFSMSSRPHDFARILPKIYRPDELSMRANLAIRREGKIRAIVGLFPMDLSVGGQILKSGGIGGVATHPRETGSGMMKQLMNTALAEMKAGGFALSVLGGQRQRYGYYGYEKAGSSLHFDLSKTNIRHFYRDRPEPDYRFMPIGSADQAALDLMRS
ncbi:MAG TPA: hypothetical protein DD640_09625, partial [Clostridiales bacterium]|nr:hypothetical protein [Clostridiales bacterium]